MKNTEQRIVKLKRVRINKKLALSELHERNYSLYESKDIEEAALEELHQRSYMILDEEETLDLLMEYDEEYDRLSRKISFVSLQRAVKTQMLFKHNASKQISDTKKRKLCNILDSLIAHKII